MASNNAKSIFNIQTSSETVDPKGGIITLPLYIPYPLSGVTVNGNSIVDASTGQKIASLDCIPDGRALELVSTIPYVRSTILSKGKEFDPILEIEDTPHGLIASSGDVNFATAGVGLNYLKQSAMLAPTAQSPSATNVVTLELVSNERRCDGGAGVVTYPINSKTTDTIVPANESLHLRASFNTSGFDSETTSSYLEIHHYKGVSSSSADFEKIETGIYGCDSSTVNLSNPHLYLSSVCDMSEIISSSFTSPGLTKTPIIIPFYTTSDAVNGVNDNFTLSGTGTDVFVVVYTTRGLKASIHPDNGTSLEDRGICVSFPALQLNETSPALVYQDKVYVSTHLVRGAATSSEASSIKYTCRGVLNTPDQVVEPPLSSNNGNNSLLYLAIIMVVVWVVISVAFSSIYIIKRK